MDQNVQTIPHWVQVVLMLFVGMVVGTLCGVAILVTLWGIGVL